MKTKSKYLKNCSEEFVYSVQSEGQKLELTEQIKKTNLPTQGTETEGMVRLGDKSHSWTSGWLNFLEEKGKGDSGNKLC